MYTPTVASHFARPDQAEALKVNPLRMSVVIQTSVQLVVFCWVKLPMQAMVDLCIYFVYIILLDDSGTDPRSDMDSFAQDLLHGREQKGTFWRLMNDHLSTRFLPQYDSFCSLAILRSTLDYFQGCWIETRNFPGVPGAHCYPFFLRRLNGLGAVCGGSLFPKDMFDEENAIEDITTVIAQIEPVIAYVNDLFSFYKEFDNPRDQINLVTNKCLAEGITIAEAFDQLTDDTIQAVERLQSVFITKHSPRVVEIMHAFVEGYTTWHFCDARFRMGEVYDVVGGTPNGDAFRDYFDIAMQVGSFDVTEWSLAPSPARSAKTENGAVTSVMSAMEECRGHVEVAIGA